MKTRSLTMPELELIVGTRVALGIGVGLILAGKLNDSKRKGAGWALLAVGVLTTVPILRSVLGKETEPGPASRRSVSSARAVRA